MGFSTKLIRIMILGATVALALTVATSAEAAPTSASNATVLLRLSPAVGPPGYPINVSGRYLGCSKVMITFQPRTGVSTILGTATVTHGRFTATVSIPAGAPAGPAYIHAEGSNPWLCSGVGTFLVCPACDAPGLRATVASRPAFGASRSIARG